MSTATMTTKAKESTEDNKDHVKKIMEVCRNVDSSGSTTTNNNYDLQEATVEMYSMNGEEGSKKMVPIAARKRGRPARNSDYEWDEEETFRLIELWSKEELLYNTSDVFYLHRDFRSQSMNRIYKSLLQEGVDLRSPTEVRNKMNNLRNYFAAEKRKERRMVNNSVPYKSSWKFYKSLSFLEYNYRPRQSVDDDNGGCLDEEGGIPTMVGRSLSSHLQPPDDEDDEEGGDASKKRRNEPTTPVNSYMTVFRKAKRNSKIMYSMNQSDNIIVETRPVVRNSTKSFVMNRSKKQHQESVEERSPPSQLLAHETVAASSPTYDDIRPRVAKSPDEHPHYREDLQEVVNANKRVTTSFSNSSNDHIPKEHRTEKPQPQQQQQQQTNTIDHSNVQNLDKCYTDLIYQILVTMPDTVEKAMLKLDFQQKLLRIKLQYSQKD